MWSHRPVNDPVELISDLTTRLALHRFTNTANLLVESKYKEICLVLRFLGLWAYGVNIIDLLIVKFLELNW